MNKLLLFLGLFLIVCLGNCQDNKVIIKEDTTIWYFANRQLSGDKIDTIYAGEMSVNWITLWYRGRYSQEKTIAGYVKQDIKNEKLWYKETLEKDSVLIFDLDLEIGDEFLFPHSGYLATVLNVYYENERKIIEFNANTGWGDNKKFIEGVGPNNSLIACWMLPGILSPYVVCQHNLSSLEYKVENPFYFIDCDFNTTDIFSVISSDIRIFPNPFNDYIKVELIKNHNQLSFRLYNDLGQLLNSGKLLEPQILNTESIKRGVYFLEIIENRNKSLKTKLIKL